MSAIPDTDTEDSGPAWLAFAIVMAFNSLAWLAIGLAIGWFSWA